MEFTIFRELLRRPRLLSWARSWIRLGLYIPDKIKRQIANEVHAEMIIRLMDAMVKNGGLTVEEALSIHFELGKEMGDQVRDLLSIDPNDARSMAGIIDFLHDLLLIKGRKYMVHSQRQSVSHWDGCSLYRQLRNNESGFYYCHLYQEMYKGVLFSINPEAHANTLSTTRSMGGQYCELRTWLGNDPPLDPREPEEHLPNPDAR